MSLCALLENTILAGIFWKSLRPSVYILKGEKHNPEGRRRAVFFSSLKKGMRRSGAHPPKAETLRKENG